MPERGAKPGQVYWNPTRQRLAVVYEVDGKRVRAVGVKVDRPAQGHVKRITWSHGVPSTWMLRK